MIELKTANLVIKGNFKREVDLYNFAIFLKQYNLQVEYIDEYNTPVISIFFDRHTYFQLCKSGKFFMTGLRSYCKGKQCAYQINSLLKKFERRVKGNGCKKKVAEKVCD